MPQIDADTQLILERTGSTFSLSYHLFYLLGSLVQYQSPGCGLIHVSLHRWVGYVSCWEGPYGAAFGEELQYWVALFTAFSMSYLHYGQF